jgi:cystathionine beta-synthase
MVLYLKQVHETGTYDPKDIHSYVTEGIGEDFVPQNYDFSVIDYIEKVGDKEAALMQRRLAKEEGLFLGNSAGSAVQGLLQIHEKFPLKSTDLVVVLSPTTMALVMLANSLTTIGCERRVIWSSSFYLKNQV